jgi:predicted  nucleic acid-binding Zn-ribbon protein
VDDLDRDIARMEKDVDQVAAGPTGTGPASTPGPARPRSSRHCRHELGTLGRRQSELEDAELELMEQRETAQGHIGPGRGKLRATRDVRAETEQRRDTTLSELDADR